MERQQHWKDLLPMTKTEYLFGHKVEKYSKLQTELARVKIEDARSVIKSQLKLIDYSGSEVDIQAHKRMVEALNAISHWNKIQEKEL